MTGDVFLIFDQGLIIFNIFILFTLLKAGLLRLHQQNKLKRNYIVSENHEPNLKVLI